MAFIAPLAASASTFLGSTAGILSLASAGIGVASAISSGNYQAAVAKNNAQIAEQNAAMAAEASQREAARSDLEYAALLGAQLAEQGASGTSVTSRSNVLARALTRRTGRMAATDIVRGGADAAQRLKQDAANFRAEARQARTQGIIGAAGAFASGLQGVAEARKKTQGSLVTRSRRPRGM